MSEKKSQIIANPSHPLRFLIDATTGAWRSRFQLNELGVHAGHRDNRNSCKWGFGGEMSLAIELGWDNSSWDSSTDRQAAVMGKPTIVIDGVEIDLDTAKWFKNEMIAGRIQETELKGMDLDNFAVSSKGWQPDEC
jgi:hypothetical protein